ncbi:hypothetical protein A9Q82_07100 [Cycloclasticus sp. 46_120_T64]|nr:hypothetical protein A9Q82_07100 [Cycloclasticus sp. 46_120_T64]
MPAKYNLHSHGPFTFQVGLGETIRHLVERVDYGNRMLMSMPAYSQIAGQLEQQAMVTGIASTDTIEGGDVSDIEAEAVLQDPKEAANNRERRIKNLASAYSFLDEYVTKNSEEPTLPITSNMVKSLHCIVSDGLTDSDYRSGEYRDHPKGIITHVGDDAHGGRYKPPTAHADICTLMTGLEKWAISDEQQNSSPLIRAGLIHYYFERIHPFYDGNGRVGRLLEKAILYHGGYQGWVKGLDRYYLDHIDDYYFAFNHCRKQEKKQPETCNTEFIELALKGMAETIERIHNNASSIASRMMGLAILGDLLRKGQINSRQHELYENIMDYAKGSITKHDLNSERWYNAMYSELSPATKSRDLNGMIKIGLLRKDGSTITAGSLQL